jgi:hypothetical protein
MVMPVDPNIDPPVLARHNGFDVYPMPMFIRLEARDMAATVRWHRQALDFGVMFEMPMMVLLRRKKFQDLLVFQSTFTGPNDPGVVLSFGEGEVEGVFERASAVATLGQARGEGPPVVTPWNARELRLVDPDGRRLVFHEQAKNPEAAARMSAMLREHGG